MITAQVEAISLSYKSSGRVVSLETKQHSFASPLSTTYSIDLWSIENPRQEGARPDQFFVIPSDAKGLLLATHAAEKRRTRIRLKGSGFIPRGDAGNRTRVLRYLSEPSPSAADEKLSGRTVPSASWYVRSSLQFPTKTISTSLW